jgi:hypothetical protein
MSKLFIPVSWPTGIEWKVSGRDQSWITDDCPTVIPRLYLSMVVRFSNRSVSIVGEWVIISTPKTNVYFIC